MNLLNNNELSAVFGGKACDANMVCTVKGTRNDYFSCDKKEASFELEFQVTSHCYDEKDEILEIFKGFIEKSSGCYVSTIECRSDEVLTV